MTLPLPQAHDTTAPATFAGLAAHYRAHGYCVARRYVDPDAIGAVLSDMMRLFEAQLRALGLPLHDWATPEGMRANLVTLFQADQERYLAAARLSQLLTSVTALQASPPLVTLLDALGLSQPAIATKPVTHLMNDDLRVVGGYHKAPPHQDWRSMQGSLDGCVIWLPLVDVDADCYPLEVVPGSHTLGLLETEPHPATPAVVDPRMTDDLYQPVTVRRGDVVALSGFLVHRTGTRGDQRVRAALSLRYNNTVEPSFVARGYPQPYTQSYRRDLITENFPSAADLAAIFPG